MLFSTTLLIAALAQSVHAFDYTIAVGKDEVTGLPGVGIDPSRTVTTGTNDRLVFHLLSGQHRLVQTSFEAPCSPIGGLDSGLQTVPSSVTTFEASNYQEIFPVANRSVIAYFADIGPAVNQSGATQCQQGAVFCLNTVETGERSCDSFKRAALALGSAAGVTTSRRTNTPFQASTSSSSAATSSIPTTSGATATGSSASPTVSRPSSAANHRFSVGNSLVGASVATLLAAVAAVAIL